MSGIRTGRTTRMLNEARKLASEGNLVYVVVAEESQRCMIQHQLGSTTIKVETPHSIRDNLDWDAMRLRGAHPTCRLLIDHYAIEKRFARVLDMLHRFDLPTSTEFPDESRCNPCTPVRETEWKFKSKLRAESQPSHPD